MPRLVLLSKALQAYASGVCLFFISKSFLLYWSFCVDVLQSHIGCALASWCESLTAGYTCRLKTYNNKRMPRWYWRERGRLLVG